MRKFITLAATCAALLALPAIAQAGCQTNAGSTQNPAPNAVTTSSGVNCTTNNGTHYTLRIYIQGNQNGWHSVSTGVLFNIYNPPNYYAQTFHASYGCAMFAAGDTQARNKSVLTNVASGTQDIDFGPALALPPDCL